MTRDERTALHNFIEEQIEAELEIFNEDTRSTDSIQQMSVSRARRDAAVARLSAVYEFVWTL